MVDQNSQFYAILTNVGAAKLANASALGLVLKITQMGIGDANGTDPTPSAMQRSLLNEWRRAPLNQLKVDDKDPSIIVAEQVIPAEAGGKWIREIGLYDADGDLIAVANCAPTYKPLLNQGSGRTQIVRMSLVVSSSSNVELKIDPSVVLATREWVAEELARQDFKHSVMVATTANIVLSGLQTIDGIALLAGNRVLVKNQTVPKDNGLYVVAAGAWIRSADADTSAKVTPGLLVHVEKGTANSDSIWQLVTDALISLGVSGLSFEMVFGRTGVTAGTYRSVTVDKNGHVIAATNPTTVAGYGLTDVYTKTEINTALAAKAPLDSPEFTGAPQVPTPPASDDSKRASNTAFVAAAIRVAISNLVASSPAALDTLNELAAALGNDPNFATTVTNALSLKAPLASPFFTGNTRVPTVEVGSNDYSAVNTFWARRLLAQYGLGHNNGGVIPATQEELGTLLSGNYYYPATISPYGSGVFTQRMVYAANRGFEISNYPYQKRIFGRASNNDGTWQAPFELANLDSPSFTGNPTGPTAAKGANTLQLANTAFVQAAVGTKAEKGTTLADYGITDAIPNINPLPGGSYDLHAENYAFISSPNESSVAQNAYWNGAQWVKHSSNKAAIVIGGADGAAFVRKWAAGVAPGAAPGFGANIAEIIDAGMQATPQDLDEGVSNKKWVSVGGLAYYFGRKLKAAGETVAGITRFATLNEVVTGASGYLAVCPSYLMSGFGYRFDSAGYIKLPAWMGGLMIQWCGSDESSSETDYRYFPVPFTSVVYGAWLQVHSGTFQGFSANYGTVLAVADLTRYVWTAAGTWGGGGKGWIFALGR